MAGLSSMPGGLKRPGSSRLRLFVTLMAVAVILFTLSVRNPAAGPLGAAKGVAQTIVLPVRYVGSFLCAPFEGLGNVFANLTADEASLSELKEENARLKAQNAQLAESSAAASRLEALLELKNTYNLQSTGARVVSGSVDSLATTVTIDKGASSGIAVGMPVTDSYGVIGQVSEVGPSTATVRLITDERSSVAAMVQSSRAQGQLQGRGTEELALSLVRADQAVEVGDLVVTSGLGGVYPKGLLLGTVASVEKRAGALYYDITVKPASSVTSLEEVLVITSLTDEQKATSDDVQAADAQEAGTAPATSDSTSQQGAAATSEGTTQQGATGASEGTAQPGSDASASGDAAGSQAVVGSTQDETQTAGADGSSSQAGGTP